MPSRYKDKQRKPQTKQDAVLPYKQHFKRPTQREMCANCGNERVKYETNTTKCYCGGSYQTYGISTDRERK